ncbi:MAG: DUF2934 domain-containing protein [Steroidobacteraceae bacterium]|jgi:DUF2934 family protein
MNAAEKDLERIDKAIHEQHRWHENREQMIADAAYYLAERRGFAPGHELDDWLDAEYQTDERLLGEGRVF